MAFGKRQSASQSREDSSASRKIFLNPGVIEEEPNSLDSVISNPNLLPLTIVPSIVRSSTCGSGLSRHSYR